MPLTDPIQITKPQVSQTSQKPDLSHYAIPDGSRPAQPIESTPRAPLSGKKYTGPFETIDLPSRGIIYPEGSVLSTGKVDIKYMTAKEEDILASQQLIKKKTVIDELLKSVIVSEGVKLSDFITGDKNAIFVHTRRLAYGDEYTFKQDCPECDHTGKVTVDLAKIENEPLDESKYTRGSNVFEFVLPVSKKVIKYKLLTQADETNIEAELRALEKVANNSVAVPEITTRLKYMILSVDDKSDRMHVKSFVETMLSKDSIALRNAIRAVSPNIDLTYEYICPKCGHAERLPIQLLAEFLWPDAESKA